MEVRIHRLAGAVIWLAGFFAPVSAHTAQRITLTNAEIRVDASESSYVRYGSKDVGDYLESLSSREPRARTSSVTIAIGRQAARDMGVDLEPIDSSGKQVSIIRSFEKDGETVIVVTGRNSQGTNESIATFMQLIRVQDGVPYVEGPLDLHSEPSYAVRGIHLNGWPLNYPYAFRSWKEADWKRFVDIAWAQRVNLFYLWPFMEIIPVPLSRDDEAYLREVQRVVEYARNQRGMEVWIMQSANRIGISDCGTPDPRMRAYWVNKCQKDMNPADPEEFAQIMRHFQAFYRIVDNADAYCMIDSDPGGWPQSPLSDQSKIFNAARKLLDAHTVGKTKTRLVDWMHVGWGRHKFFASTNAVGGAYDWTEANPDESDVAFMGETIRNFKRNLVEPWGLIAGQPAYLSIIEKEVVLGKAVYLPYGAIEAEPAFPTTNLGQDTVRRVFDKAAQYPGLRGVMGNNQLMQLQMPRTFYFYATAWDEQYRDRSESDVLLDLAAQLHPDHSQLIADSFLALREANSVRIGARLRELEEILREGSIGRAGPIGRFLFPDQFVIVRNLRMQLEIRFARQVLLEALSGSPDVEKCAGLIENYLDKLLTWNKETGWDRMIDITVWQQPIYEGGDDFTEGMYKLKQILAQGGPYTPYAKVSEFFDSIAGRLLRKYDQDSVMVGAIEPLKLAVIQSQ